MKVFSCVVFGKIVRSRFFWIYSRLYISYTVFWWIESWGKLCTQQDKKTWLENHVLFVYQIIRPPPLIFTFHCVNFICFVFFALSSIIFTPTGEFDGSVSMPIFFFFFFSFPTMRFQMVSRERIFQITSITTSPTLPFKMLIVCCVLQSTICSVFSKTNKKNNSATSFKGGEKISCVSYSFSTTSI